MLRRCALDESSEAVRNLALELLTQGIRCQVQGFGEQAEAVLRQSWSIAGAHEADLAHRIAWELAWLLLRRKAFAEAAVWMQRVGDLPTQPSPLWPANRQALAELCLASACRASGASKYGERVWRCQAAACVR
jgi:hypothetical protein